MIHVYIDSLFQATADLVVGAWFRVCKVRCK